MLQAIMKTLLGYIGKERHADSLVEKLMLRFEAAVKEDQWKNLAYCLTQVGQKSSHAIISDLTASTGTGGCISANRLTQQEYLWQNSSNGAQ